MTESTPDFKTFDVADMFTGKAYPKLTVVTYMDEDAMFQVRNLLNVIDGLEGNALKAAEKKMKELRERAEKSKYTFHLTGVSREDRQAIHDLVRSEFPAEHDFLGREKPNPSADDKYANLYWALHIEKIERPDGAVLVAPDEATIKIIRGNAPDPVVAAVEKGLHDLSSDIKAGFEALVQGHDFLS